MKRFTMVLATLAVAAGFTFSAHAFSVPPALDVAQNPIIKVSDGHYSCGWFAVTVCSKNFNGAKQGVNKFGGYVIHTDDIDGFRNGWQCAVKGPFSKSKAQQKKKQARQNGAKSAYIKKGCGVNL